MEEQTENTEKTELQTPLTLEKEAAEAEKNKKLVEKFYPVDKRQLWLIFMCFFAYTVSYVTRYSYNSNISAIIEAYGITKAKAGLVSTFYFFAYGIGQVVNGIFCKYYNKKYVIASSLSVSAIVNVILFFSPSFAVYKWLWLVNGAALSVLWTSLIAILSKNLKNAFLQRGVFVMSISVAAGTCLSYGTGAIFNAFHAYHFAFLFATILAVGFVIAWLFSYDYLTKPSEIPVLEEAKETAKKQNAQGRGGLTAWVLLSVFIFPGVLVAVVNLIKDGLNTWVPEILKNTFGYPNEISMVLTLVLPLVGMGGSAVALALHKKVKNYLTLSGILYCVAALFLGVTLGVLYSAQTGVVSAVVIVVAFGALSLLTHSVNSVMTSIAPMYLREEYDSGMLAGILNGCAYVGSTVSSYGLGALADAHGWNGTFLLLLGLAIFAACVGLVVPVFGRIARRKSGGKGM